MNGCRVEEVVGAGVRRRAGSSRVLSGPLGSSRGSARQGIEDEEANARMSGARDNTGRHQGWWVG